MLIDAHNHLQDIRFVGDQISIIAQMRLAGVQGCVVNGTNHSDWGYVAELAERFSGYVHPSFGLHPWKVKDRPRNWLDQLTKHLQKFPSAGVGECGLDRWIKDHDIDDQRSVFRTQLELAVDLERPCTIHCLKAWGPLLEELNSCDWLPRILLHSFGGSIETAKQLVDLGAYFSFSGYFLHQRKAKIVDVFKSLPKDRILVETDAPDMAPPDEDRPFKHETFNHPANLVQIESRLKELVGVTSEQLFENTLRWLQPSAYN
jgi:TatD DNase family protein